MFPAKPVPITVSVQGSHHDGWTAEPVIDEEASVPVRAVGLHYGQIAFEGMRAALTESGLAAFRPELHHRRLCRSMERLGMPPVEWVSFARALGTLLTHVVPPLSLAPDEFLYVRPIALATDPDWSMGGAERFALHVLAGWTRPAYHRVARVVARVESHRRRAWPGGTGDVKVPANYGTTVVAERTARGEGAHLVLWLDPTDRAVEEFSSTSVLFVDGTGCLVAPPPSSTVLDGVTRRSALQLASELGMPVREETFRWPASRSELDRMAGTLMAAGTATGLVVVSEVVEGGQVDRGSWTSSPSDAADRLRSLLASAYRGEIRPAWSSTGAQLQEVE